MNAIKIKISENGAIDKKFIKIGNKYSHESNRLVFEVPLSLMDPSFFSYVIFISPLGEQYAYPIFNGSKDISSAITKMPGRWTLLYLTKSSEIVGTEIIDNKFLFVSDIIQADVEENNLSAGDLADQPMDEDLKIIYDDFLMKYTEAIKAAENAKSSELNAKDCVDEAKEIVASFDANTQEAIDLVNVQIAAELAEAKKNFSEHALLITDENIDKIVSKGNEQLSLIDDSIKEVESLVETARGKAEVVTAKALESSQSASEAKSSETLAKISEKNVSNSEANANKAVTASQSAALSSESARDIAIAKATQAETKASEALTSANASKVSQISASESEVKAKSSEQNAKMSETNSKTSESNSNEAEIKALEYSQTSKTHAEISTLAAAQSSQSKTDALAYSKNSENSAIRAEEAAKKAEGIAGGEVVLLTDIIDSLDSDNGKKVLSAKQGKSLNELMGSIDTKKVDKIAGMQLSKNDFTDEFMNKLTELHDYDDTSLREDLDYLMSTVTSRVAMLENVIFNDIESNPYLIMFENLDGITAGGVWNEVLRRIEC